MKRWKLGWKSISTIGFVLAIALITLTSSPHKQGSAGKQMPLSIPNIDTSKEYVQSKAEPWQTTAVNRGDTLSGLCNRLKIKPTDLHYFTQKDKQLISLHPGDQLSFNLNSKHELIGVKYSINPTKTVILTRQDSSIKKIIVPKPMTTVLSYKSAVIKRSLFRSATRAGITSTMVSQLQQIFGGRVNFKRDIRSGDHIDFLYQELYINGKKYRNGDIVAAELTHGKETYRAVRYTYPVAHTGYYTPDGHGVEPAFLRYPVQYRRISSRFNLYRFDPVIHKYHAHLGVDFATHAGTPIKSIGDGRVVSIGHDGGYGKAVRIRYDRHQVALYAHMSRFASNIHHYTRVHKGQVIGYVGKTGWATGPHLHFGFYVDGKARNWLALKLPTGKSIPHSYEKKFFADAKRLIAELQIYRATQLAMNNIKPPKHPRS